MAILLLAPAIDMSLYELVTAGDTRVANQIAADAAVVDSALGGPLDTATTNPTVTLGASTITVHTATWENARNTPVLTAAQIFNVANGGVASFTQRGVAIAPTGTGGGGGGTTVITIPGPGLGID